MKEKPLPSTEENDTFLYPDDRHLGWFLFMQFFGADERSQEMSSGPVIYSGTFIWQKSDGTSEKITVPGKYKVPAGETMVLISQLPDTLQETDIAIRSSLQDVNVYINNELRTSYSTRETRLAGKILPAVIYSVRFLPAMPENSSALS